MNKKKGMILVGILLIIAIFVVLLFININKANKVEKEGTEESQTAEIYEKIAETNQIKLVRTLDENNQIITIIKGENAYKEIRKNNLTTKYIVKEGDTYYIDDANNKYYKYQNNTTILNEIENELSEIKNTSNVTGKEKINGKTYMYEEFSGSKYFLVNDNLASNSSDDIKTRFYYENDELVYIKTIIDDKEEIQKVELSYDNVNDDYFTIPENYIDGNIK